MATLAPDFQRIADSLLDQVKTFDHKVGSRSVGTVSAVYDGVALASGLGDVAANELVEFGNGVAGIGRWEAGEVGCDDPRTVSAVGPAVRRIRRPSAKDSAAPRRRHRRASGRATAATGSRGRPG